MTSRLSKLFSKIAPRIEYALLSEMRLFAEIYSSNILLEQSLTACMRESFECSSPAVLHKAAIIHPPRMLLVPRPCVVW